MATVVCVGTLLSQPGCGAIERAEWKRRYLDRPGGLQGGQVTHFAEVAGEHEQPYELNLTFDPREFDDSVVLVSEVGRVTVYTDADRAAIDQPLADRLADRYERARQSAFVDLGIDSPLRVVIRIIYLPESPTRYHVSSPFYDDTYVAIHFVADEPLSGAVDYDRLYLDMHELVEITLTDPTVPPVALPDASGRFLGLIPFESRNRTRWFRDGLATYGAYCAATVVDPDLTEKTGLFGHPLSSLARVGPALFDWHQDQPRPSRDEYNASFGLFLLLEQRYGMEAIRSAIQAAAEVDYPDGPALVAAVNGVLGIDLRQAVASFDFPQWSLRYNDRGEVLGIEVLDPSWVDELQVGDLVVFADGRSIQSTLALELAWLEAREQGRPLELSIWRDGQAIGVTAYPALTAHRQ
ncbi:MAG: hypothetical protein AAGK09_08135 [Planctomycetota bacterium]